MINNNFTIIESPVSDYGYIVLSNSFESLTNNLSSISKELLKANFKGEVLFDYLLSKGSLRDRFFKIYFDGRNFDTKTFKTAKNIDQSIKHLSINYYYIHYNELIKESILPAPTKFLIRKKAII